MRKDLIPSLLGIPPIQAGNRFRFNKNTVSFKYKDYRVEGPDRYKVMTLS